MARELLASQVSNFNISDQQFVTNLYEAFLQRGPDAGGLAFWTSAAGPNSSTKRQNVLNGFAVCGPFKELSGALYREVFWQVGDQLGTPRMLISKTGSLSGVKRHDYMPFGEELFAGIGGRTGGTNGLGYGPSGGDGVRQQFTQKERDDESGLDYFEARYYSASQGRFTSSDPIALSMDRLTDPQRINLYTYARNNPLAYIDPNGEDTIVTTTKVYTFEIQRGGKAWSEHVIITVTETTVTRTDDNGKVIQRGVSASATAVNAADAKNQLNDTQLKQIGQVAGVIAEEAAHLNVDRGVAFAIAKRESFFGRDDDKLNSTVNPLKITAGTGRPELNPGPDLRSNVDKALLWFHIVADGKPLAEGLQNGYGPGKGKNREVTPTAPL